MELKLLDLFSGIGGFSLGLESTGYFETIAFVEKDKFCHEVLKKNFNNIPIESEVRNVKGNKYKADIITGGFPCQPFSVAGKRKGTDDDRYLWDETIRIIQECKPRWFIGENVEGIINIQNGMVLRQVCNDLEEEGFEVQCLVIPASSIGAWHQRKRVWIIAHSNSNRDRNEITSSNGEEKKIQREHWKNDSTSGKSFRTNSNDVPNTNSGMRRGWGTKQSSGANQEWGFCVEEKEQTQHDIRSKTVGCDVVLGETKDAANTSSEGSQRHGVSTDMETKQRSEEFTTETSVAEQQTWWEAQSDICRNVNGISYELDKDRKNRIKALGNSIVPLIARQLGLAIMKAEQDG